MSGRRVAYLNARLLDPASGLDAPGGLLTEDGVIADLGPELTGAALAVLFGLAATPAAAGNQQAADIEYSSCVAACQQGQSEAKCAAYCQCTTSRTQSEFSRQESRQFAKAMLFGGEIDAAFADKFRGIIMDCAAKTLR